VLLVVPAEAGQPAHSSHKGSHDRHGHGAFSQSINQLCLKHASKHRQSVESKWKVCKVLNNFSCGKIPKNVTTRTIKLNKGKAEYKNLTIIIHELLQHMLTNRQTYIKASQSS